MNTKKSLSIQKKLLLYFLAIAVAPVIITGACAIYFATTPLLYFALNPVKNHVVSYANHIRQELYNVREDILYASRLPGMSRLLTFYQESSDAERVNLQEDMVNSFVELLSKRKKYHYISYIDETGRETVRVNFSLPDSWRVIVGDQLQNKSHTDFFINSIGLPLGEVYVSPTILNEENGILETPYTEVIYLATPVQDINGQIKGIITIALRAEVLFKPLVEWRISQYPSAESFVVNEKGFYIAHSNSDKTRGKQHLLEMKWSIFSDYPAEISGTLLQSKEDGFLETRDSVLVYTRCSPVFLQKQHSWGIVASVSRTKVYRTIDHFKYMFAAILIVTLAMVIFIAYFLSKQFTLPITRLRTGAKLISGGDLTHRIDVTAFDEIGELAYDFNLMTEQLQGLYQNLEDKVSQRTEMLQKAMEDLKHKDELLEESNQATLDFLKNLSIQLRTPLTSVIGQLSLLEKNIYGELTSKQQIAIKKIHKNLFETFKWLDGIIRISTLASAQTSGDLRVNKQDFSVSQSITQAIHSIQYALSEKNMLLKFESADDLSIYSDKEKIDEIISSVLHAVVHHPLTHDGIITITVSSEKQEAIIVSKIIFSTEYPESEKIDDIYKALTEPFIHSPTFFNITNLSICVSRALLIILNGSLEVGFGKEKNVISITISF
ncbi:HAMP domain-containing protein [bacterium]|nr:HAMP domain-containing protein [bacterium]